MQWIVGRSEPESLQRGSARDAFSLVRGINMNILEYLLILYTHSHKWSPTILTSTSCSRHVTRGSYDLSFGTSKNPIALTVILLGQSSNSHMNHSDIAN